MRIISILRLQRYVGMENPIATLTTFGIPRVISSAASAPPLSTLLSYASSALTSA